MKIIIVYALGVLLAIGAISCKKDDPADDNHPQTETGDTSKPVIQITSPAEGAMYTSGDTLKIRGVMTDQSLHESLILIQEKTSGQVLYQQNPYVHDLTTYNISYDWKVQVSSHTDAVLSVFAEDHSDHSDSVKINLHFMP